MTRIPALLCLALGLPGTGDCAAANAPGWSGRLAVTARAVGVDGDRAKYDQHVNLDDGVRLEELVVKRAGAGSGPDHIGVGLFDLGGDPHERIEVSVREFGRYRFDYRRRRSEYVYDDILIPPEDASAEGSTGGDFHRFDFDRVQDQGRVELSVTDRAAVEASYDRYRKRGDSTTVLDVEREEFAMEQPLRESLRIAALGLRYRFDAATLVITERYREYDNDGSIFLPGFSAGSDPEAPAELARFTLEKPVGHDSREHVLQLRVQPDARSELDVNVTRADLDGSHRARERALGTTFAGEPLERDTTGGGDLNRDTTVVDVHGRYAVTERVRLVAGLRYRDLDQRGTVTFGATSDHSDWTLRSTALELGVEASLTPALRASAGWTGERRKQRYRLEAEPTQRVDEQTGHDGYFVDLSWSPIRGLGLELMVEDASIDDAFTLTSATDRRRYRAQARYRWGEAWSVAASHRHTERRNGNTGWEARHRHSELRLSYTAPRLLLSLGAVRVTTDRDITQSVFNLVRRRVFDIDYESRADFLDAAASWQVTDRLRLGGGARHYRNDGSFEVDRDDLEAHAELGFAGGYAVRIGYRSIDYQEADLESYDAHLTELSLRKRW